MLTVIKSRVFFRNSRINMSTTQLQPEWVKNQAGQTCFLRRQNDQFEQYYAMQKVCDTDEEWQECLAALRADLPQSFRLNSSKSPDVLRKLVKTLQSYSENVVQPKPWPKEGALPIVWQFQSLSRWRLKECPELAPLQAFLTAQRNCGNLSRQELVSMIPVFLLDVQPHHKVLDMCASPGSKTKHVLEIMHAKLEKRASIHFPPGLVIANEMDVSRCDKLVQNVVQFSSPCALFVNHDGQDFPDIQLDQDTCIRYDRIVCDVPCSGDGTIRKNPTIWQNWSPRKGNSRHFVQYNIAERGIELLDVNGIMAYSSCSMNPIENEAVIARLLKVSDGALELLDCSQQLPGFKFSPGFLDWKVANPSLEICPDFAQVEPRYRNTQICQGMFPDVAFNRENNLQFCMRLLPHHSNDGGFFVALLKKVKPLPWQNEQGYDSHEMLAKFGSLVSPKLRKTFKRQTLNNPVERRPKMLKKLTIAARPGKVGNFFVDCKKHFNFAAAEPKMKAILDFYGLDTHTNSMELFFAPGKSHIYLANKAIKAIVSREQSSKLNIFYGGLRVFRPDERMTGANTHCLTSTGRAYLTSFIGRQVKITPSDMKALLESPSLLISEQMSPFGQENCGQIEDIGPVKFTCENDEGVLIEAMGYKSKTKAFLELNQDEKYHALMMLEV